MATPVHQLPGVHNGVRTGLGGGAIGRGWSFWTGLGLGTGGGVVLAGGDAMVAVTSRGTDFRNRISMRRRCGSSRGAPSIASVSSEFTSCAPDSGKSLYSANNGLCRSTLTTDTALANPSPALSAGTRVAIFEVPLRTEGRRMRNSWHSELRLSAWASPRWRPRH